MKKSIIILLLFLPLVLWAQEYTVTSIPNPKRANVANYVSNPDGILTRGEVDEINSILASLEADTKAEVAVVLVNSIGNEDIEDFSVRLFEEWGIGKSKVDNGLLILFVLDQRAISFEVGYGLEGVVTDALSKRIQIQAMLPYFKEGNYGRGIVEGLERVGALVREEPVPDLEEKKIDWSEILPIAIGAYILWGLLAFLWMNSALRSVRKNPKLHTNKERYAAFKHKVASVDSMMIFLLPIILTFVVGYFTQVVFGLLALPLILTAVPASLYGNAQKRKIRTAPTPCPVCGREMHLLSEKEDNQYLTPAQDLEEKLGSVDYDVFLCDLHDGGKAIYPYVDPTSSYLVCPSCKTHAYRQVKSYTLIAATYSRSGTKRTEFECKYCGHKGHQDTPIPKLEKVTVVAGGVGGGLSRGGGFSGGSFGGGRSGGGGATSRW